jgi:hypothetical protein
MLSRSRPPRRRRGAEAHVAWPEPAVSSDSEMNMGPLHERLEPFRERLARFELELASATLPRRKRLWRWWRGTDLRTGNGAAGSTESVAEPPGPAPDKAA